MYDIKDRGDSNYDVVEDKTGYTVRSFTSGLVADNFVKRLSNGKGFMGQVPIFFFYGEWTPSK